jgi:hypothetical protein
LPAASTTVAYVFIIVIYKPFSVLLTSREDA